MMGKQTDQIIAAIQDPKTKVVSFDVFDTLLLRPFWEPTDLFSFLDREASRLYKTPDVIRFSEFRKTYELEARDQAIAPGKEDITFDEIYNYIAKKGPFPEEIVMALKEKEKQLELQFCYARESAKQLIEAAIKSGKHVIATSDMYLPSDFILELLRKSEITEIKQMFVSGETGRTKGSGHLYDYVVKQMGVQAGEIVHIGDNEKTDVRIPAKLGIRAFCYPRTITLFSKGKRGRAYRHAYEQFRSSVSNFHANGELGIRCMLAVAANRVYDDPFRTVRGEGDYSGDIVLFGNLGLGMYCLGQGLWVYNLAREKQYDRVLFFSRDGYLPYLAYQMIREREHCASPEAFYVRISRKALLPLLLSSEARAMSVGTHLLYLDHSPKSMTKLMAPVLRNGAEAQLSSGLSESWDQAFKSEADLVNHMNLLYRQFTDKEKLERYEKGFATYFSPLMEGQVLTYDVGYSLRNEIMLKEYFPEVKIDACFTHSGDDISLRRAAQAGISLHSFYSSTPYVSWLPRELFLTECASSCTGYTFEGEPILEKEAEIETLLADLQNEAVDYLNDFISRFGEDVSWLPLQPANASVPFETFLHSPSTGDSKWIRNLNAENEAASGLRVFKCYDFWRKLRVDYWAASHHLGKYGRYTLLCLLLLFTDRYELGKAIKKRTPHRVRRIMEKYTARKKP